MGALLFARLDGGVRLDVAPPPAVLAAGVGGTIVLAGLCVFVIVIGIVAFFVIRAVRKNRAAKETAAAATAPQESKENS
jgi:Na+-transporting methylmalonyl-CoA/oxaloacetate decarboxylase gamma subunit